MKKLYLLFLLFIFISSKSYSQTVNVTGTIKDSEGYALDGITIGELGTTNGTVSDYDGRFSIDVQSGANLVFSGIGYQTLTFPLTNGQSFLDVSLQDATFELTGVEVLGSRNLNRSITNSPVPIDYIDITAVSNQQGNLDLNQLLQYLAPSFNANRQSGADGADHVDPATLRGLGPDQTLVLINGKRQHQSSLVNIFGTRGRGNTGTDLDAIPVSAIDHIEILRDGASAQYGSDAIAGVINIVLKSNTGEFTGNFNTGMNSASNRFDTKSFDGQQLELNGNYGLKLMNDGFINLSSDFLMKNHTNRANVSGTPFESSTGVRDQFGEAGMSNFGTFFNSMLPMGNNTQLYAFGGYNFRNTDAYAWTRGAGEGRNVISIYPNGFNPHIASIITDNSFSAGVRGKLGMWDVDFNNTFGQNKFHFYGDSTLNASLEDRSPTHFDDGGFQFSQNTTSLDFSHYYPNCLSGENVAFGLEYRVDHYQIFAGDEASWKTYGPVIFSIDSAFDDQGNFSGMDTSYRPGGAQGFPGFQPSNVIDAFRTNVAGYFDFEINFTKKFMADIALRDENYSDFGNTFNYKLATRYAFSDKFSLRGSVSSGFRAPSLAQIYFNSTFTDVVAGVIIDKVIAANNSPVARALGIPSLKQETAQNISLGFTANPINGLSLTFDAYQIQIKDRIVLTGAFTSDDPVIGADLVAQHVGAAEFFTNAVNTTTQGADVILNYVTYMNNNSHFDFNVTGNFNTMTIDKIYTNDKLAGKEDTYFGEREQKFLLASAPPHKINVGIAYTIKHFNAALHLNNFGQVDLIDWNGDPYSYTAKNTFDLNLGYNLTNNLSLNIGGLNITNVYPDQYDPYLTESGGLWDAVQMGYDGAFWYGKLNFKF